MTISQFFKRRKISELNFLKSFLENKNIKYKIFDYTSTYKENNFINYLKDSKYGIWLDASESQGFALQEALSSNVPLLVWNARHMYFQIGIPDKKKREKNGVRNENKVAQGACNT